MKYVNNFVITLYKQSNKILANIKFHYHFKLRPKKTMAGNYLSFLFNYQLISKTLFTSVYSLNVMPHYYPKIGLCIGHNYYI